MISLFCLACKNRLYSVLKALSIVIAATFIRTDRQTREECVLLVWTTSRQRDSSSRMTPFSSKKNRYTFSQQHTKQKQTNKQQWDLESRQHPTPKQLFNWHKNPKVWLNQALDMAEKALKMPKPL